MSRQCVYEQKVPDSVAQSKAADSETDLHSITQAFAVPTLNQICVTNHEKNIQFFSTDDLKLCKQVQALDHTHTQHTQTGMAT